MHRVGTCMVLGLMAEFVMGRVCEGPSLSRAEFVVGRDVPESMWARCLRPTSIGTMVRTMLATIVVRFVL